MGMKRLSETTDVKIANNIKRWHKRATPENIEAGMTWYDDAMRFSRKLARDYKQMISHYRDGHDTWKGLKICTYDDNKVRAWSILTEGEHITEDTPKIHSFAMNVGNRSPDHVTIDKWHMRASLARPRDGITLTQESPTKLQYKRVEGITLDIARMHKLKGYELQAIVWVTIKEKWNRK